MVLGTIERDDVIKEEVRNYLSEDLELSNMDKVFQVIVKAAIFEFLYKPKISKKIIIKEYLFNLSEGSKDTKLIHYYFNTVKYK